MKPFILADRRACKGASCLCGSVLCVLVLREVLDAGRSPPAAPVPSGHRSTEVTAKRPLATCGSLIIINKLKNIQCLLDL